MTNKLVKDMIKKLQHVEELEEYRKDLKEREESLGILMRGSNDMYLLGRIEELADVIEMLDGIFGAL